jgi:hypothetical protein
MGVGQDQKSTVIDGQAQASVPLRASPSNPVVPVFQMLGGGAEKQYGQPVALCIHCRVMHLLPYSFQTAQIVVLAEQTLTLPTLLRLREQDHPDLFQLYLSSLAGLVRRQFLSFHAADLKKFEGKCPAKSALIR